MKSKSTNILEKLAIKYSQSVFKSNRPIQSFKAVTQVITVFSLIMIGAMIYKAIMFSNGSVSHFKLLVSSIDISELLHINPFAFATAVFIEILRFAILALAGFYLIRFLSHIQIDNPFGSSKANSALNILALMAAAFFVTDVVGSLLLNYYQTFLAEGTRIHLFRVEFFIVVYFINVFAFIFKRGAELKEEIDLVI